MKKQISFLIFLLFAIVTFGQTFTLQLDFNDTTYLRILNGEIVNNNYHIQDFGNIQYLSETQKEKLGIQTIKPVMMINFKQFSIEYKIDSILYSRKDFITTFKYPSSIELPIAVNGKLLSYEERKTALAKLSIDQIKEIKYLDKDLTSSKNWLTPFGVIDLELRS